MRYTKPESSEYAEHDQARIFFSREGDHYFQRMRDAMLAPRWEKVDPVLYLMRKHRLRPQRVLEVGCSLGWRLGVIHKRFGSRCMGIDPSAQGIRESRQRYKGVRFERGLAETLPTKIGETFNLVIVYFVLHWVAREALLKAIAEIDRSVSENGYLILGDFLPDHPVRVPYHHLPGKGIYTYKLDYANLFLSSGLYKKVGGVVFNHRTWKHTRNVPADYRGVCTVLQKSSQGFYKFHMLKR